MTEAVFIGVDVGTTAVKAAAYTAAGYQVALARQSVQVCRPDDGFSELSMDLLWDNVQRCLKDVVAEINSSDVRTHQWCAPHLGLSQPQRL